MQGANILLEPGVFPRLLQPDERLAEAVKRIGTCCC